MYNITGVTVDRSSKNVQAVAEFQGCGMDQKDLTKFFSDFVKDAKRGDDAVSKYVGDKATGSSCGEALLDIEFIMGPAPGIKTEFWLKQPFDLCSDVAAWASVFAGVFFDAASASETISRRRWSKPRTRRSCTRSPTACKGPTRRATKRARSRRSRTTS